MTLILRAGRFFGPVPEASALALARGLGTPRAARRPSSAIPTALNFTGLIPAQHQRRARIVSSDQVGAQLRKLAGQLEKKGGIELFAREAYSFESSHRYHRICESSISLRKGIGDSIPAADGSSRADLAFVIGFSDHMHLTQDFTDDVNSLAHGVTVLENRGCRNLSPMAGRKRYFQADSIAIRRRCAFLS